MLRRKLPGGRMSEAAELFLGWSNRGSIALYTPRAQEEPFDHPVWLCVCRLALHTLTLVLNPLTRVGWAVTRGHLKPDCGIYWGIGNNPVLSGRWVWWSQGPHRPCPCKTKCECAGWTETSQLTWDHVSSGTVGSISSKWTWRTRPDSVEQLRLILCLVFVFISQIVKLLWVMSASGGARSKHCPVCRSAVWVKVQRHCTGGLRKVQAVSSFLP